MGKKVSYQNLLKQAIAEFDTSKTIDVRGPMLEPILKWDGQGELPIYKDAASILERYYFNEDRDEGIEVYEQLKNEDGTEAKTASEKEAEGEGTEQAGTGPESNMTARKKSIEKDLAKEDLDFLDEEDLDILGLNEAEDEGEGTKQAGGQDVPGQVDKELTDDENEVTEDLENAVIEKLIAEMEEEGEEGEEKKDLNVDKEAEVKEAAGPGAVPPPSMKDKMDKEDQGEEEETYEEAFNIFKEAIENEEEGEEEGKEEEDEEED